MTDPELPPDLAELERQLADHPGADPPPDLGPRVLAAARDALRRRPARPMWRTWAAAAAVVLVGINLSMSVSAGTDWDLAPAADPAVTVDRLRALAPDLPEAELRRQALLTRAAAGLTPTAHLTPNWDRFREPEEHDRWDGR